MKRLTSIKDKIKCTTTLGQGLLLTATLFIPLLGNAAEKREVIVGVRNDEAAVSYLDKEGNYTGFEGETLKKIFALLPQYDFKLQYVVQSNLFPSLTANKVDVVQGNLRRTEARENTGIRTRVAYNWMPYVLVVPVDNTTIHSLADLSGKRVNQTRGSGQARILENYIKEHQANIELIYSSDYLNLLVGGHVDAFLLPIFDVSTINANFEFKVKAVDTVNGAAGTPESDPNVYYWFRPGDTQLRDDFSQAIATLRADGSLSNLSLQFFKVDYPSSIDKETEKNLVEQSEAKK